MKFLLIDLGNTRIKWGWSDGERILYGGSGTTANCGDSQAFVALQEAMQSAPEFQVWISSVVSQECLQQFIETQLAALPAQRISVVKVSQSACGIDNAYAQQQRLGVDRWVAVIGARAICAAGDLIVVDAGTATTIDWLDIDNVYQGGAILPGLQLMHDALTKKTAGIRVEFEKSGQLIGKSTSECVNSGVLHGAIGAVSHVVAEFRNHIGRPTTVLLTGGGAPTLVSSAWKSWVLEPDLVLLGLLRLARQTS